MANCKRCLAQGKQTEIPVGDIKVGVYDWATITSIGVTPNTEGVNLLVDHHNISREYYDSEGRKVVIEDNDNHNDFLIFQGRNSVALLSVNTFSAEHRIYIEDEKLAGQFHEEIREAQRKHRYGPEFR